jgi:RNA polymerase sigma-70 factor (ECF subfamily)
MDYGSERDMVRRMLGGDEVAFDEFFADYFPRLFRFAVLRVRDQDAAEDIVQNSLISAVHNLGSWRGEASLFTWLCTICRREISAWAKRTSRSVIVPIADDDPDLRAALDSIGAAAEAPDAGLEREDTGRIVQLALDHLPPRYSRALEWKYLDEVSVDEIAGRLQCTPKAAESLLTRARGAFRDAFVTIRCATCCGNRGRRPSMPPARHAFAERFIRRGGTRLTARASGSGASRSRPLRCSSPPSRRVS